MTADEAIAALRAAARADERAGMARYGIPDTHALGVPVRTIKALAKRIGRDHGLAATLWETGIYEARVLAAHIDRPTEVTPAQMDVWAGDFDSWAICDTVCFQLFDRTPYAWDKVSDWMGDEAPYTYRAALALIWALMVHDKAAPDARFEAFLPDIARAAAHPHDHVAKGASMALRATGKRSAGLHAAALAVADDLASCEGSAARIGRETRRDLTTSATLRRIGA